MRVIELTQGMVAVVDDDQFERLAQWRWHFNCGYARRKQKVPGVREFKTIYMHREVMGIPPEGFEIDHRNSNKCDNRRENLRFVTRAQNSHNKTSQKNNQLGIKGVYRKPINGRYYSKIRDSHGKDIWLGYFDTPEQAKAAYDAAAPLYQGEFHRLN